MCDPPQDFDAKGESMLMTRINFKTKEFILIHFSTLAIFPHCFRGHPWDNEKVEQKSVVKF